MKVYQCIAAVSREIAKVGIAKDRKNEQQGYKFRGIDEVLNALAPVLAAQGLVILPRMTERTVTERLTTKGGVLFYVAVRAEFDFVAVEDNSRHTVVMYGEAMDSGDKATNKAMSAAYKYAALQTFCIPLEGMAADADTTTHEVVAAAPEGFEPWLQRLEGVAAQGLDPLRAAWATSRKSFQEHLTMTDKARWEQIKATAAAVKPVAREAVTA